MVNDNQDNYKYYAFISYSSKDGKIAKKLHNKLETYQIPKDLIGRPGRDGPVPSKIFPVFRDRDELPLSSDLGATIEDALKASRYLIVLCSLNSAQSHWVNEEIRYFKSIGRSDRILALMINGEPNATDIVGEEQTECFPPALRFTVDKNGELTTVRAEPIAGDLRAGGDGWTSAFLKCIAGITGLGFDAFARREQKRQTIRRSIVAVFALMFISGGVWSWDYNRVKVSYFKAVGAKWGVPFGIGELSLDTYSHRNISYKFEYQRRKVIAYSRVNSAGMLKGDPNDLKTSQWKLTYRDDGILEGILRLNHNDKEIQTDKYSYFGEREGVVVSFKKGAGNVAMQIVSLPRKRGEQIENARSNIGQHRLFFSSDGFFSKKHYETLYGSKAIDPLGRIGQKYQYSKVGLQKTIKSIAENGSDFVNLSGIVEEQISYDEEYNRTSWSFFGINGEPLLHQNGYTQATQTNDDYGNPIEWAYYGLNGNLIIRRGGYAKVIQKYNYRGYKTEQSYISTNATPTLRMGRYAKINWKYDDNGTLIEEFFIGINGEPIILKQGFSKQTWQHDEYGNVKEYAFFGLDYKPTLHQNGYSKVIQKYDDQKNLIEVSYVGTDGQKVLNKRGFTKKIQSYNNRGYLSEVEFYGTNNQPKLIKDGFVKIKQKYDIRGNFIEVALFGVDGNPIRGIYGYSIYKQKFDEFGNKIEISYYGVDGKPIQHYNGYARYTRIYNKRGNLIEEATYGTNGKLKVTGNGYARKTNKYDSRGNILETSYYWVDGTLATNLQGYARIIFEFDINNNRIGWARYNFNGDYLSGYGTLKQNNQH